MRNCPSNDLLETNNGPSGSFVDYLLSRLDVRDIWESHIRHPFIGRIGDGSLPQEGFKRYLVQDYLFLVHYARIVALGAYKARRVEDLFNAARYIKHLQEETKLHIAYCSEFGLSKDEIESCEEHPACIAYTRYLLEVGYSEDWLALQVAVIPCMVGYKAIGKHLLESTSTVREGNRYWKWIENYAGDEYNQATDIGSGGFSLHRNVQWQMLRLPKASLEQHAANLSQQRIEELVKIFIRAIQVS